MTEKERGNIFCRCETKMAPKKSLYERRLESSKKIFKSRFKSRPSRWLWTVKETEDDCPATDLSETDSEHADSVPLDDDSLQGDISEMSEDERGIVKEYLKIHRRYRSK